MSFEYVIELWCAWYALQRLKPECIFTVRDWKKDCSQDWGRRSAAGTKKKKKKTGGETEQDNE